MTAPARRQRRLAAILAADVVGYSRLMGRDEQGTLDRLKGHLSALIDPTIAAHHGRIVKTTGDGLLAEFPSVVAAVECAVAVQTGMAAQDAALPEDERMRFRVGVNLGDVIVDEGDIFGDGVNVAARLQEVAVPGGICLSDDAYRQVRGKLNIETTDLGEQRLKNIAEPLRAHALKLETTTSVEVPKPAPPDKPSIAVLAFDNMSADPEQEYFADGITEDIITELSKISGLLVIARNSSFAYKGKGLGVRQIGRELGVRYVLEGSVRKAGNRVRINAQLIDSTNDQHLWADRFDGDLTDVFGLQDEVTEKVVQGLAVRLKGGEQLHRVRAETTNPEAYDCVLRGLEQYSRCTRDANVEAEVMFKKAIALDPNYVRAHAQLGQTYSQAWMQIWTQDRAATLEKANECAERAVELDPNVASGFTVLGNVRLWQFRHDEALLAVDRAIELEPNNATAYAIRSMTLSWSGRPQEAMAPIEHAIRLDPNHPPWYLWAKGHAHLMAGENEEAAAMFRRGIVRQTEFMPFHLYLAVATARLGKLEEARRHFAEAVRISPIVADGLPRSVPYTRTEDRERIESTIATIRQAGTDNTA